MEPAQINMVLNVITVLLGGGLLGVILRHRYQMRQLTIGDDGDIRDHYAEEVKRYVDEVKTLRDMIIAQDTRYASLLASYDELHKVSEQRHRECVSEREELRVELNGLKRQILRYSAEGLIVLEGANCPSDKSPHSVAAAERVRDISDAGDQLRQAFPPAKKGDDK